MYNYEDNSKKIKVMLEEKTKKYNHISNSRMFVSCLGIFLFIYSIIKRSKVSFVLFICACVAFVYFLVLHNKVADEREYLESKLSVITKRWKRLTDQWAEFEETGEEFLREESYVQKDLDIFGKNSLYQYMCVASTVEGKEKLASYLTETNPEIKRIKEREEAVRELLEKNEFSFELETLCRLNGKKHKDNNHQWYYSFLEYLERKSPLVMRGFNVCSVIFPVVSLLLVYLALHKIIGFEIIVIMFTLQIGMAYYVGYKNKNIIGKVFMFCLSIEKVLDIINYIEKTQFESKYLKNIRSKLVNNGKATTTIEKLNGLNEVFAIQRNPYIHIMLQMFFMFDIHCIRLLENWKKSYACNIKELFQVIGEMEALLSLSMVGLDRRTSFPELIDGKKPILVGIEMYHPLIDGNKVVSNSFTMEDGIQLITGSNMSGKTTFMRTIGINVVLAYAGAPVCANRMKLSIMKIFTSMRVIDDVSKGVSSFYAEVLRMKSIVEYSKKEKPMLVFIDEIFKGTNSADRIIGAQEILKGMNKIHIIAFVSTHDFELCKLVEDHEIKGNNHHFMEYYKGNKIYFDYKLKKGKCKTTNAKYLLKMAGLF